MNQMTQMVTNIILTKVRFMKIPVYVINLDKAIGLWDSLKLANFGADISLTRIPAIYGKSISVNDWQNFDKDAFEATNGRPALAGEYGCYQSHLLALRTFLESGEPYALILEDDIAPNGKIAEHVAEIIHAMPGLEIVKVLNHRTRFFMKLIGTSSGVELGRTIFGPQGSAAAYIISRDGASKLVDELAVMKRPWDVALERFWDTGVSVFSTSENIVSLSEHAAVSNIIGEVNYKDILFSFQKLIRIWVGQIKDGFVRAHNVLLVPTEYRYTNNTLSILSNTTVAKIKDTNFKFLNNIYELFFAIVLLLFISSVWVESDMYRFAGVGMILFALVNYFRVDFFTYSKPLIGWPGALCVLWATYVGVRMAYSMLINPELGLGASEGIYIFPIFYATLGYAFYIYVRRPFYIALAFIAICLLMLTGWTDFSGIMQGNRAITFLQNNPIHASVGAGFIVLISFAFIIYTSRQFEIEKKIRLFYCLIGAVVFTLALINIYALQSKGVWLAITITLPLLIFLLLGKRPSRTLIYMAIATLAVCTILLYGFSNQILSVAGTTAETSYKIAQSMLTGNGIRTSIDVAVSDPLTPESARARLLIWANAIDIWAQHPVNGAGIAWLSEWQNRTYKETSFTVLHNGYLEIAVRYGIVGILFYATLFWWSINQVRMAVRSLLVDPVAGRLYQVLLMFFLVTILSNSNNRLAIGESFVWFFVSVGFYCYFELQKKMLVKTRTYF